MSTVWLVLVHPYHDNLIDVLAFDDKGKAESVRGVIEEAAEQRRHLLNSYHAARASGIDRESADAAYDEALKGWSTKWTPRLGKRIVDGMGDLDCIEVEEREIR